MGFPACQAVGKQVAWRYNVEATKSVFGQAVDLGVERFVFSSTYSNYGLSPDGAPVTEESPLNPQSLYAETKIAAEEFLLRQKESSCAPLIFRFATLYGISPRTRFDLIVNQFVLEAFTKRQLIIYQRGYSRSFVHIRDVVRGVMLGLEAEREKICGEVFNLGTDQVPVHGHQHETGVRADGVDLHELVAVVAQKRNRVAHAEAEAPKGVDETVSSLVQSGPGEGATLVGDGYLVTLLLHELPSELHLFPSSGRGCRRLGQADSNCKLTGGGVPKRPNGRASKAREPSRAPWVQIPPPPRNRPHVARIVWLAHHVGTANVCRLTRASPGDRVPARPEDMGT